MLETVRALNESYEFTVGYGAEYDTKPVERLESWDIETESFPLMRHYNPLTALPAVASLARYLSFKEFNIIHTHSTEAGIIGRFAAALAGVPHIVHGVHGVPFTEDRNDILNRFILECERQAAKYTDCIATNANVITEGYLERGIGNPEQYTTIYSGVDLDAFQDVTSAQDLLGRRPRVVMIGRLNDGKGHEVLLDSLELMSDWEGSVCIVGEGPLYDSLEASIEERGLSGQVFLTGYRDDVPRVLAASDILVLPSFREGTPRVITEAMASGLPVVATNIAGIPEQVDDGKSGYLIPTGDAEALSERLEVLLDDSELREEMGERGSERVERFSVEAMARDTDTVYKELLSR